MEIFIAIISILIIAGLAKIWGYLFGFKVCPICAGVSGTWLWMLAMQFFGFEIVDPLIIAVLMGGSVVGIAYTLGKRVPAYLDLAWKTTFIVLGFAAVYELLTKEIFLFILFIAAASAATWFFISRKKEGADTRDSKAKEIEKGLEDCC